MGTGLTLRLLLAKDFCLLIALVSIYDFIRILLSGFMRKNNLFIFNLKILNCAWAYNLKLFSSFNHIFMINKIEHY